VEYNAHPTEGQRRLARELVALGADVIVGHHPHWVQDHETISGVPVYYSLGNLIFDQMWSEETKKGLVVRLTFENKKQINEELLPVYMKNHAQPQFVSPQ
jgi:poly-gamma-glutamate synthesis protein (capsule biosynthesis protein)